MSSKNSLGRCGVKVDNNYCPHRKCICAAWSQKRHERGEQGCGAMIFGGKCLEADY